MSDSLIKEYDQKKKNRQLYINTHIKLSTISFRVIFCCFTMCVCMFIPSLLVYYMYRCWLYAIVFTSLHVLCVVCGFDRVLRFHTEVNRSL